MMFTRKNKRSADVAWVEEHERLVADLREAEAQWRTALDKFNAAVGNDQIDYAIYNLGAAEVRLGMLQRELKRQWDEERAVAAAPAVRPGETPFVGKDGAAG